MAFWRSKKAVDSEQSSEPDQSVESPESEATDAASAQPAEAKPRGLLAKMRGALTKTRQALNTDIRDLFKSEGRLVDDAFLDELFERLIRTDMGVGPAETIRDDVGDRLRARVVHLEDVLETIVHRLPPPTGTHTQ